MTTLTQHSASAPSQSERAWAAVLHGDVAALDAALGAGADPDFRHALAGHALLAQAIKAPARAQEMSAVLIARGATVPAVDDPLAFELAWQAIIGDSALLAKQLINQGAPWNDYLQAERAKYVTARPTQLDDLLSALDALAEVDRFNAKHSLRGATGGPGTESLRP